MYFRVILNRLWYAIGLKKVLIQLLYRGNVLYWSPKTKNFMLKVEYDPQRELVVVITSGTVSFEELIKGTEILNREDLPLDLKAIDDATNINYDIEVDQIPFIIGNILNKISRFNSVKHAIVHAAPINTAYSLMAETEIKNSNYHLKTFSTREAALKWLGVNPDEDTEK